MNNLRIDINADLGEGIGNEAQLMPFLSSCNIACGGHHGDAISMKHSVKLANIHNVKIGAHPAFPDKKKFGRVLMDISSEDLFKSLQDQVNALINVTNKEGIALNHVKPHGALYNLAAKDAETAKIIVKVVKSIGLPIQLYVPYNSVIAAIATQNKIPIVYEAFADRNYNDDLSLVSRQHKQAIIEDHEAMFKHVYSIIRNNTLKTLLGREIEIKAETFCIHGDHPKAIILIRELKKRLEKKGISIA